MEKAVTSDTIQHDGTVETIAGDSVTIRITPSSACSGCHAEGSCNLSGKEDKLVTVAGKYNVECGDHVKVAMEQSMGYKAVMLGYVIPLIVLILSLIILISFSVSELTAGLISVLVLIPYYSIVYCFRKRINRNFTFTLKTI